MIRERSKTRIRKLEGTHPTGGDEEIPFAADAQPLFTKCWAACAKYVGSDTSRTFKDLIWGALGDSLALDPRRCLKTIELKHVETMVSLLAWKGITV